MKILLFVFLLSTIFPVYSADEVSVPKNSARVKALTELKPAEIWKPRDSDDPYSSLVHDTLRAIIADYPVKRKGEFLCLHDDVKTGSSYYLVDEGRSGRKSNFDLLKGLGVDPTSWRIDIESINDGYVNIQLQYGVGLKKGGALASMNVLIDKDWELCHLYHVLVRSCLHYGETIFVDDSVFNEKKKSSFKENKPRKKGIK